jgi:hypothetical protein
MHTSAVHRQPYTLSAEKWFGWGTLAVPRKIQWIIIIEVIIIIKIVEVELRKIEGIIIIIINSWGSTIRKLKPVSAFLVALLLAHGAFISQWLLHRPAKTIVISATCINRL